MGGKGALNYLPIVPKAFVYVPKVMRKPVMGGNTMSETYTPYEFRKLSRTCFSSKVYEVSKTGPDSQFGA